MMCRTDLEAKARLQAEQIDSQARLIDQLRAERAEAQRDLARVKLALERANRRLDAFQRNPREAAERIFAAE